MFRFIPRIASVILLVVASTLAPAAAEDRPFYASGVGHAEYWNWSMYGTGGGIHLGRSSLGIGYFPDYLQEGIFIPAGGGYLKSANGDDLEFQFDEPHYFFDPATGVVSATVTFTGGTGRFQDATGSADVILDFDSDFYHFDVLIDGSIDY